MALVDHETEEPDIVSLLEDKKPPFGSFPPLARYTTTASTAKRRDAFDEAGILRGEDRRNHHPALYIVSVEGASILGLGLAMLKRCVVDRLPGIGVDLFEDLICVAQLQVGEEGRKSDRYRAPGAIFLVKSVIGSQQRMDPRVAVRGEFETAMTGGLVRDDPCAIGDRVLRRSPGGCAPRCDRTAIEQSHLVNMKVHPFDGLAKPCFVNAIIAAPMKVGGRPIGKRARKAPCLDEVKAILGRHHREGLLADAGDENVFSGSAIFNDNSLGHRKLLSDERKRKRRRIQPAARVGWKGEVLFGCFAEAGAFVLFAVLGLLIVRLDVRRGHLWHVSFVVTGRLACRVFVRLCRSKTRGPG